MDVETKRKRPQIVDSLKCKSEPHARFKIGVNLTNPLCPKQPHEARGHYLLLTQKAI